MYDHALEPNKGSRTLMASSLFALLDDIATVLDDVALLTKMAAKKTAGVVSDDLAVNAHQVTGVAADREWPVVRKVAVGSLKNKLILIPAALVISAVAPWLVPVLLVIGGLFLCYEGAEKLLERWLHPREVDAAEAVIHEAVLDLSVDMETLENEKIKGAIRTDFILSAEIIVIALGEVAHADLLTQTSALLAIGLAMTVGVYGMVALIVKIDDAGLYLQGKSSQALQHLGGAMLWLAPWLMRTLGVLGTVAMFAVGGAILLHQVPWIPESVAHLSGVTGVLVGVGVGLLAGMVVVLGHWLIERLKGQAKA